MLTHVFIHIMTQLGSNLNYFSCCFQDFSIFFLCLHNIGETFVCFFSSGSDTFVEVGMPRSPSHSANGSELKQMLASCKTSPGKRQAVEFLQGTKNSYLQYVCVYKDPWRLLVDFFFFFWMKWYLTEMKRKSTDFVLIKARCYCINDRWLVIPAEWNRI